MPTIKVHLSSSGIEQAIREVDEYAEKIAKLGENVTKRLTSDGVKTAQEMAMYMNAYDSGELVGGIVEEYHDGKGYVHSTAPHTAFVEMGTGVVGQNSPNPNGSYPGWAYDVNSHGEAGWFYVGKDGKRHWTKGMPSRPFMYDTAQIIKESVSHVVAEELTNDRH